MRFDNDEDLEAMRERGIWDDDDEEEEKKKQEEDGLGQVRYNPTQLSRFELCQFLKPYPTLISWICFQGTQAFKYQTTKIS